MKKLFIAILSAFAMMGMAQSQSHPLIDIARGYIGTPYVARTLEGNAQEELVINCDEVDCQTFVEYVLAEAMTPVGEDGNKNESVFAENVQKLRYKEGIISGYASRLHYASDWVNNAVSHHYLTDITADYGIKMPQKTINFMSRNPKFYPPLADSLEMERVKFVEKVLSRTPVYYLPKTRITDAGPDWIADGDIILLCTNIRGLDVSHFGFAIHVDGKLHLLHASSTDKQVMISKIPLGTMLKGFSRCPGIRVLRIKQ